MQKESQKHTPTPHRTAIKLNLKMSAAISFRRLPTLTDVFFLFFACQFICWRDGRMVRSRDRLVYCCCWHSLLLCLSARRPLPLCQLAAALHSTDERQGKSSALGTTAEIGGLEAKMVRNLAASLKPRHLHSTTEQGKAAHRLRARALAAVCAIPSTSDTATDLCACSGAGGLTVAGAPNWHSALCARQCRELRARGLQACAVQLRAHRSLCCPVFLQTSTLASAPSIMSRATFQHSAGRSPTSRRIKRSTGAAGAERWLCS